LLYLILYQSFSKMFALFFLVHLTLGLSNFVLQLGLFVSLLIASIRFVWSAVNAVMGSIPILWSVVKCVAKILVVAVLNVIAGLTMLASAFIVVASFITYLLWKLYVQGKTLCPPTITVIHREHHYKLFRLRWTFHYPLVSLCCKVSSFLAHSKTFAMPETLKRRVTANDAPVAAVKEPRMRGQDERQSCGTIREQQLRHQRDKPLLGSFRVKCKESGLVVRRSARHLEKRNLHASEA
jgi:hypothetical protein